MSYNILKFKKKEDFTDIEWNTSLQYIIDNYAKDLENWNYKYVTEELSKLKDKNPFLVLLQLFQEENIAYELNEIPEYTFVYSDITEIEIPDSVKKISDCAFCYCRSLQSIIIPNSVKEIGRNAFYSCISLQSIIIPNTVEEIREWTFDNCLSLRSIIIPNSVKKIGENAFRYCTSLQSITIPNSVKEIGEYAFSHYPNLIIHTKNPYVIEYCKKYDLSYDENV